MKTKYILTAASVTWEADDVIHQSIHSSLESAKAWANNMFNCQSYIEIDGAFYCSIGNLDCVIFQKQMEEEYA